MHINIYLHNVRVHSYEREQNCSNNDRLNPKRIKIPILPLSIRYLSVNTRAESTTS